LATFANEVAANVIEAPSAQVIALFNARNDEIKALGIPLSQSDEDIQFRIDRHDTPFLSINDEIFFEPGRLSFEYRLAVYEEEGEMSMLMDESPFTNEKPARKPYGLCSSVSNLSVKFSPFEETTFTDMPMVTDEAMPTLLPCLASLDKLCVVREPFE
jgi:hypothetical protein